MPNVTDVPFKPSDADPRFAPFEECLDLIDSSISTDGSNASLTEIASVSKARAHLMKLASNRLVQRSSSSVEQTPSNEEFSDFFLDAFTGKAFLQELDALRQSEGSKMTDEDFLTLAQSIRDFGLSIPEPDREIFRKSVLESSK